MSLAAGDRLGAYEVVGTIGAGAMGEVYRAKDIRLGRDIALKILPATFASDVDRLTRFETEARTLAALSHPNILSVFDLGTHDGQPYLALELLEGETLGEKLRAGMLPLSKAIDYARQVAAGLSAAHAAGVTHRDIKPENLFVTTDGRVKILDFGLARLATGPADSAETHLQGGTAAGVVLGTVGYMSPEQVRGEIADPRSDLFGLGVVLYEMLAGARPFTGETSVQAMNAILTEDPPAIERETRSMPPALERLVRHCLEKNPEERFQSARDLAFALEALSGTSVGSSVGAQPPLDVSRPRRHIAPLAAAALVGLAAGLAATVLLGPADTDVGRYRFRAVATDPEQEGSAAWSPDGQAIAYLKVVDGINQLFIRQPDLDQPVQLTDGGAGVSGPFWWPDSSRLGFTRGDEVLTVSRAGGEPEVLQAAGDQSGLRDLADAMLSPDGTTLAMLGVGEENLSTVYLASPADATPVKYEPAPFEQGCCASPNYLQFSPDGRWLFFSHFGLYRDGGTPTAWLIPLPAGSGAPRELFRAAELRHLQTLDAAWMPDSRHLVVSFQALDAPAPGLWLADVEDETLTPITASLLGLQGPSVSPDGTRIALTAGGPDFDLVAIPLDRSPVRNVLATSRNEYGGSWIPSSSRFLYVTNRSGPQELRLRTEAEDTDRRIQIEMMASTGTIVGAPLASPDGQRVAYHSIGSGSSAVWIVPIGGGTPTRLYEEDALQVSPVWSPAGQQIAVWRLGLGLSVVRVGGRSEPVVLSDRAHSEPIAAWSPNGEWIAYQDDEGLQLVSPDGTERRSLTPMLAVGLAWSADSRTIYAQRTRPQDLVAVDVATGRETTLRSFGPDFTYGTPSSPGQRFTLSPDGRSILATVVRVRSDIWILDGFRPPGGLLDWLRR